MTVTVSVVIGLLALTAMFAGVLPVPLFGIAMLVIVRGIFRRYE